MDVVLKLKFSVTCDVIFTVSVLWSEMADTKLRSLRKPFLQ